MTYEVRLLPAAERVYRKADRPLAGKLARCLEQLERNPRQHNNIRSLKGKLAGYHRYRVGDHRVIFSVNDDDAVVTVLLITHRKDAYD